VLVLLTGSSRAWEMGSVAVLASVQGDAKGLIHKVALLEGELAEACQAQEVAEEKVRSLSSSSAVRGAFSSMGLGQRVVPHHHRLIEGEESLTCEYAGRCPPPHWEV
jgi:hypothetical protein